MPQSWVPSSSAQRAMATLFRTAAGGARGEVAGTGASRCRLQAGSLCLCVSRSRSRGSGWRPLERSSLNPWPQRTTRVRCYYCTWYSVCVHQTACECPLLTPSFFDILQMKPTWEGGSDWKSLTCWFAGVQDAISILLGHSRLKAWLPQDAPEPVSGKWTLTLCLTGRTAWHHWRMTSSDSVWDYNVTFWRSNISWI